MTTNGTRFVNALKRRGYTPKSVLQRLGLDSSYLLLGADQELRQEEQLLHRRGMPVGDIQKLVDVHVGISDPRGQGGGPGSTVGTAGDDTIEQTGQQIVDRFGSFDRARGARDTDPPVEHPDAEQNLGGQDDEPDDLDAFRGYLQDRGLSRDEAEEACKIVQDSRRARRSNGHDKTFGRDRFPVNAVRSSERPAPSRGHFGGERRSGETQTNGALGERYGMDSAGRKRMAKMFPHLARIGHEPSVATSDRHAMDAAPAQSTRQRERMLKMFPDMARIGSSMDTGHVAGDGDRRGKYEV
jgi:hypothetical protein